MNSFRQVLDNWESFDFYDFLNTRSGSDIKRVLNKKIIDELDFLTLLSPAADNFLEDIAIKSSKTTIREFGKTIQIYTPLYLSNYCSNRCLYCGFNSDNKIKREKLSTEEMEIEAEKIRELGLQHVLLLTGGDRKNSSIDYINNAVVTLKNFFNSISIEMYAMTEPEYKDLISLGVDNITMYQETYNKKLYKKLHISGEKSDYDFRLNSPERAAKAGARSVNLGVLLGLHNPIEDFFKASIHCNYIKSKYPGCDVAISLPRIRKAAGSFMVEHPTDDILMSKMIMAYRLFIPRGGISMSTRESQKLRDNLLPLGVTKMSAQSKTSVGGHSSEKSDPQFEISDLRSVLELNNDLINNGYQPVYKDWVMI